VWGEAVVGEWHHRKARVAICAEMGSFSWRGRLLQAGLPVQQIFKKLGSVSFFAVGPEIYRIYS